MTEGSKVPKHWQLKKLGEVCSFQMGQAPHSSTYNSDKRGTLLIKAGDWGELYPTPKDYTTNPIAFCEEGDILICVVGATSGKVNLGINASITRSVAAIKPNKELVRQKYVYYFQKLNYSKNNRLASGSAQGIISKPILFNTVIPLPPIIEQDSIISKIEELFSDLGNGKQQLLKAKEQLKIYRQSLLKAAFEGKLTEEWRRSLVRIQSGSQTNETNTRLTNGSRVRIPTESYEVGSGLEPESMAAEPEVGYVPKVGIEPTRENVPRRGIEPLNGKVRSTGIEPVKQVPEGRFELAHLEGWKWVKLEEVLDFVGSGITPKGGQSVYKTEGIVFLRSQNVYPNKLELDDVAYIDEAIDDKMKRTRVFPNDVLLNITGASIGRCAFVPKPFPKANVNQHVCILRTKQDVLDRAFLSGYLNSPMAQREIMNTQSGATRQGLNFQQIRNLEVPICSLEEQHEIMSELESKLSVCDKIEETIDNSLQQAEILRQSILKRAFEGRLVY